MRNTEPSRFDAIIEEHLHVLKGYLNNFDNNSHMDRLLIMSLGTILAQFVKKIKDTKKGYFSVIELTNTLCDVLEEMAKETRATQEEIQATEEVQP